MKFKAMILPVVCGSILAFSFVFNTFAAGGLPGSAEDPVVTKSYVDKLFSELTASLNNSGSSNNTATNTATTGKIEISEYQMEFIIEEVTEKIRAQIAVLQTQTQKPAETATVEIPAYIPVSLSAGEILIGAEGAEIILRSGTAKGYTMVADGLANTTTGQDIGNNVDIGRNNLLIVPRADGRGVQATTDVWLLVKGEYHITK